MWLNFLKKKACFSALIDAAIVLGETQPANSFAFLIVRKK